MKRILVGIFTIVTVAALVSRATAAVWSDTATSTGNTFAAGALNLKLSDNNETDQDSVVVTWNGANMMPGGASTIATLNLKNIGNPGANHVHIAVANTITPAGGLPGSTETDLITKHLQIVSLTYDGASVLGLVTDANGNTYSDLQDFETLGIPGIGAHTGGGKLLLTDLNINHPLVMEVRLNADSPDENQGDLDTMVLTATLHQADGQ